MRERCQKGGSSQGREVLASFLHARGFGYRSKLSSPVTAATSCSRLSPHLAWGPLSLRQVIRALRTRAEALSTQNSATAREWLVCLEGFRMRLHWRSHNMQKFEALPQIEHSNVMSGYDGLRDEARQSDDELRSLVSVSPSVSMSGNAGAAFDAAAAAAMIVVAGGSTGEGWSGLELERRA